MKKHLALAAAALMLILVQPALGVVLLNDANALKAMFPDAEKIVTEEKTLTPDQMAAVKGQLGDKWTLYPAGSKTDEVKENNKITFYFGTKAGKQTGVALMEVQPGKWGPVKYIIAMDLAGKVTNAAVMSYVEQRGRPISTKRFLGQFTGKTSKSPIQVGKDIDAVSGATISSRASAFAVKKVVVLYNVAYLATPAGQSE